jgi:hypothetical protein
MHTTPTLTQLSFLGKTNGGSTYLMQALDGQFAGANSFPLAGLLVLIYLLVIFTFEKEALISDKVNQYVLASAMWGLMLAWFFAPIMIMQTRLFDFYIAPLVFLVGNLRLNKWTFWGTMFVAFLLYARLEIWHNFIVR